MYSMVLMTALATSSASPAWGHRCHGCSAPSCSCNFACSSCYGCTGNVGYGAAGGCYGYHGGCYGAFGNGYMNPYGPYNYSPYAYHNSCYGCYGGYSCYGMPLPSPIPGLKAPPVRDPFPPINPDVKKDPNVEEVNPPKEKKKDDKKLEEARAKVRIEVPVGGKLFVDGRHVNVEAGTRVFQTPVLDAGEAYFYDVRIELADRSEQRRVVIRAGQDALVSFPSLRPGGTATAQVQR